MPPKRPTFTPDVVRTHTRKVISMQAKKDIVQKSESGMSTTKLGKEYGLAKSTVSTILKQKRLIVEEMEKILRTCIIDKQKKGESVSETFICDKAVSIYNRLQVSVPAASYIKFEQFNASGAWFKRFIKKVEMVGAGDADIKFFNSTFIADENGVVEHEREFSVQYQRLVAKESESKSSIEDFEGTEKKISTSELMRMLKMWNQLKYFCSRHPNTEVANVNVCNFDDNVMSYFRRLLSSRRRNRSLSGNFGSLPRTSAEAQLDQIASFRTPQIASPEGSKNVDNFCHTNTTSRQRKPCSITRLKEAYPDQILPNELNTDYLQPEDIKQEAPIWQTKTEVDLPEMEFKEEPINDPLGDPLSQSAPLNFIDFCSVKTEPTEF